MSARTAAVIAAVLMSVFANFGHAEPSATQTLPAAGGEPYPEHLYYVATPDALIRQGIDQLRGFLAASPNAPTDVVHAFVSQQIAPYFDFQYMAQWAAGPLLHRLNPAQRGALTAQLQMLFIDALARNLGTLERPLPQVDVFPARPGQSMSDAIVYARVLGQNMQSRLEFRFYWDGYRWRVYDAAANGSSAVAYYRHYFTTMLRRHGPDAVLR